jgi:Glycosyl transferase family 2
MQIAAVTTVRNECDIVESFVRHNATFFDRLYILDHRSRDATPDILRRLADEGLPLTLSRDDHGIFYQGPMMTRLVGRAVDDHPWDFVFPLDGDELLRARDRAALESMLADLGESTIGLLDIVNYIPTANDDPHEPDAPRRIGHRTKTIPAIDSKIHKVVIPGAMIRQAGFSLNEGHHGVRINGKAVAERRLEEPSLAHFPVRSIDQFILRSILCRLSWTSRSDYHPGWGWHYGTFVEQLKARPTVTAADLTEAALLYVNIYNLPGATPHQNMLTYEPLSPAYDQLRYADLIKVSVLPPLLDMMDVLIGELGRERATAAESTAAAEGSKLREYFRIGKKQG